MNRADKSEALAAWAKIYHDNDAARKAKALRLLAYRRMGQLAGELRPSHLRKKGKGSGKGGLPGPAALLREHGLSVGGADAARALALMSEERFNRYANSSHPPAPTTLFAYGKGSSPEWVVFKIAFGSFSGACGRHEPHKMAAGLTPVEAGWARKKAQFLIDWLDEFERRLPR